MSHNRVPQKLLFGMAYTQRRLAKGQWHSNFTLVKFVLNAQ